MNRKMLTGVIIVITSLIILILSVNKSAVSQERTRDGWES